MPCEPGLPGPCTTHPDALPAYSPLDYDELTRVAAAGCQQILHQLASQEELWVRIELAERAGLALPTQHLLAGDAEHRVRYALARNPTLLPEVQLLIIAGEWDIVRPLGFNPALTGEAAEAILVHPGHQSIREGLAARCDELGLTERLCTHPEIFIRSKAAEATRDPAALDAFGEDPEVMVQTALMRNEHAPVRPHWQASVGVRHPEPLREFLEAEGLDPSWASVAAEFRGTLAELVELARTCLRTSV